MRKNETPTASGNGGNRAKTPPAGQSDESKNDDPAKSINGPVASLTPVISQMAGANSVDRKAPQWQDVLVAASAASIVGASVHLDAMGIEGLPSDSTQLEDQRADQAMFGEIEHGINVAAARDGYRRAGRAWMRAPVFVAMDELSKEQIEQLLRDPQIRMIGAQRPAAPKAD